jgi:hypothetical protein
MREEKTLNKAVVDYDVDKKIWILAEDYEDDIFPWTIKAGFKFDLASIPRFLWSIIAPFELSVEAPLVHDYCYKYPDKFCTRKQADKFFRDIMKREGVPYWKRVVAYRAVRMFAGAVWERHK